jgi:integrase
LPYAELPDFMIALAAMEGVAPRALEFCILMATRTSEVLGAKWSEIDLDAKLWIVPAERMKARHPHRVPLSAEAMAILKQMKLLGSDWVFPSPTTKKRTGKAKDRPLSNMALLATLKRMKRAEITTHGFRSTFRDWAAEKTDFPNEVAEAALAHMVGDRVEAAYRRGDLFDKRRDLMVAWAGYCASAHTRTTELGQVSHPILAPNQA